MATDILLKTAIFGGDPLAVADLQNPGGEEHVPDPVGELIEKMRLGDLNKSVGFDWNAPVSVCADAPLEKSAPKDGVVTERNGKQLWKYYYQGGTCWRMEVDDPELPDGRMFFDGEGNELRAA